MPLARDVVTSALQFKHQIKKIRSLVFSFPSIVAVTKALRKI